MALLTVVADDLTGALDTGVKFCGEGRVVSVHWHVATAPCDVLAIDTDSRGLPVEQAAALVTRRAQDVRGAAYKKVDSTLRGPFAAESWALAQAMGLRGVLLAPASPAQGRSVRGGNLYVHGQPLVQAGFASDPTGSPGASDVAAIVAAQVRVEVAHLGLGAIRAGAGAVADALSERRGVVVADSESDTDLLTLARALGLAAGWLPCGSAGLAQAIATERGWHPAPARLTADVRPQLAVCGSHNSASRVQVSSLAAALGLTPVQAGSEAETRAALLEQLRTYTVAVGVLPAVSLSRAEATAALQSLARAAAGLVRSESLHSLFVTGGETLKLVADRLQVTGLQPVGELQPGVVLSRAAVSFGEPLSIISRAGGFGDAGLLVRLMAPAA